MIDLSNIKKSFLLAAALVILAAAALITLAISLGAQQKLVLSSPFRVMKNPLVTWSVPEAEASRRGDGLWTAVETGDSLKESQSVRTGSEGNVDIRFDGGTLVRVAGDSLVSIDDISLQKVDLRVEQGRLISRFNKLTGRENHRVVTPSAVCGIRGTELVFDVTPGETVIYGMSGHTEVASADGPAAPVLLGFQQKTSVRKGEMPSSPEAMTPEEVAYFRMLLDSLHDSEVVLVTTSLNFEPDSSALTADSSAELERIARRLKKLRKEVVIAGHTADVGDRAGQYTLSVERAEEVKNRLVTLGIKASRLEVRGYGGSLPVEDNATPAGRAANRRVEFILN